jgi:hypothetical protein
MFYYFKMALNDIVHNSVYKIKEIDMKVNERLCNYYDNSLVKNVVSNEQGISTGNIIGGIALLATGAFMGAAAYSLYKEGNAESMGCAIGFGIPSTIAGIITLKGAFEKKDYIEY